MNDWILLLPFLTSCVAGESHKTLFVLFIFIVFSCLYYGWKKSQGQLWIKYLCLEKEYFVPEPQLAQPCKASLHSEVRTKVKQKKNWKEKESNRWSFFNLLKLCVVNIWFASNRSVSKIFLWPDGQFSEITMDSILRKKPWVNRRLTWNTWELPCEMEFMLLKAKL